MYSPIGIIPLLACLALLVKSGASEGESGKPPPAPPEAQSGGGSLINAFKRAQENLKEDSSDDCNPQLTDHTLQFLQIDNAQLGKDVRIDTGFSDIDGDCSIRKTDFDKLRAFMLEMGFLQDPGSLNLINDQDTNLKLHCGQEGRWRAVNLNTEKEDKEFDEKGLFSTDLNIVAPVGYRYFRKYSCFSLKKECSHTFYVITRPRPRIQFPLQAMEDTDYQFKCVVGACTSGDTDDRHEDGCEIGGKKANTNPQGPYSIEMRVPKKIFKKDFKFPEGWSMPRSCKDDTEKIRDQIYWKVTKDGQEIQDGISESSGVKIKTTKKDKTGILGIEVEIKKASKKNHAGYYECVVIDKNGIPSTPWHGNFSFKKRYSGKAKLHVRPLIMVIIPAAFIGGTLLLMFIIWIVFRNKDHMENDDGTPYAKMDSVTPVQEPEKKAEKTEQENTGKPTKSDQKPDNSTKVDEKADKPKPENRPETHEKPKKE